jgi:hypothetical protein
MKHLKCGFWPLYQNSMFHYFCKLFASETLEAWIKLKTSAFISKTLRTFSSDEQVVEAEVDEASHTTVPSVGEAWGQCYNRYFRRFLNQFSVIFLKNDIITISLCKNGSNLIRISRGLLLLDGLLHLPPLVNFIN